MRPRPRPRGRNCPVSGIAASGGAAHNRRRAPHASVFVVYPGITALDLVGPHEVFAATGGYDVTIAAPEPGRS